MTAIGGRKIALGEQSLWLWDNWLPEMQADLLLEQLQQILPWRHDRIRLYGREVRVPRLQCWVGDVGMRYRYSGLTLEPEPWPACLRPVRKRLQAETGYAFNSVLCNWYRSGSDSMGWHSDDEPELGPAPVVASLTLGQTRRFQFRRKGRHKGYCKGHGRAELTLELLHNSLLLMPPQVQAHWQHQLPKSRKAMTGRINLTFRQIKAP